MAATDDDVWNEEGSDLEIADKSSRRTEEEIFKVSLRMYTYILTKYSLFYIVLIFISIIICFILLGNPQNQPSGALFRVPIRE